MLSPETPQLNPCLLLLKELLTERNREQRAIVANADGSLRIRWSKLSEPLNRELAPEFWARLLAAELLPASWHRHPMRRFRIYKFCSGCMGTGTTLGGDPYVQPCAACDGRGHWTTSGPSAIPETVRTCLSFAANPQAIEKAEQLTLSARQRLAIWNLRSGRCKYDIVSDELEPLAQLCWRVVSAKANPLHLSRRQNHLHGVLVDAVSRAAGYRRRQFPQLPQDAHQIHLWPVSYGARASPEIDRSGDRVWRLLADSGTTVPAFGMSKTFPKTFKARGKRFSELENPFEPLCAIWSLGYILEELTPTDAFLVAPAIASTQG